MMLVLDSSVIVPLFHEEEQSDNAVRLFELCDEAKISLAISPLVHCEVGNCLVQFTKGTNRDASAYMEKLLEMDLKEIPLDRDVLMGALAISREHRLTFYDAVHVSSASRTGTNLITLDREILTRMDNSLDLDEAIDLIETVLDATKAN
ncbi:MAG: type II toxin-antitoxin system VapC family toxin [Candidatus Thermoplasmatota archaeon]|jgi:predicted nucleic acid-binding protein|nr:type II toxin-antitoxin system VapC family toxin [Candidatus Thermoplasmatota archaeon]